MQTGRRRFFGALLGAGAATTSLVAATPVREGEVERGMMCVSPMCPRCGRVFDCRLPYDLATGRIDTSEAFTPIEQVCDCGWTGEIIRYRRL